MTQNRGIGLTSAACLGLYLGLYQVAASVAARFFLLGAGPGSLDCLTVQGRRLLNRADAIVYDALVDSSLLQELAAKL